MTEIEIEKGIPIPSHRWGIRTETINKMEPGDSVFIKVPGSIQGWRNSALKCGCTITTRKEGEGRRLWVVSREKKE